EVFALLGLATFLCLQGNLARTWGVGWILVASSLPITLGALAQLKIPLPIPQSRAHRGILAGAVSAGGLVLAMAPWWCTDYQPSHAARLLFNSNVLIAAQSGHPVRALRFLDEARNVAVTEGERGTYTVWKYSAAQFQIRENGIPVGLVSSDPEIHPN